ncbi:MAG: hypothetical protein GVY19_05120 [Bacteroidetes bacterium]|jgi:hypothetical protein|nr:hypothetical protein [Bacteroidota bacterium]
MKSRFRLGQKIYIHGRKPGKIKNKMLVGGKFHYEVVDEDGGVNQYKEKEISFFKE